MIRVRIFEEMAREGFKCEESFAVWRSANENKRVDFAMPCHIDKNL